MTQDAPLNPTTKAATTFARKVVINLGLGSLLLVATVAHAADPLFARTNLLAWCIVPFDTQKRGPEERAQMLDDLGIKKLAYDWRAEHIPTFDAEVSAM